MADQNTPNKNLRARNLALMGVLAVMVVLFYVLTIVRMGGAGSN